MGGEGLPVQAEALIFDFDGVVADTEPLYWRAWASLLAPLAIDLSWDDYCRFGRGVKDERMLATLPQLGGDPSLIATVRERMKGRDVLVRRWCREECPVRSSTAEMLRSLAGFRLGLVTSSKRGDVEPILLRAGIGSVFEAMVCGDDTLRHKPDPEPYLLIRERMGIDSGLAFEDSDAGFESATAAGLQAIRVEDPAHLPGIVRKIVG